jgi:hypothetical protein
MIPMAASRRSLHELGRFRRRCGEHCIIETAGVGFPAAADDSSRATTSATGREADRRRSRISHCYVAGIIAPSMRRAISSIASPTVSFDSGDPMANFYPKFRCRLSCTVILRHFSENGTMPQA